jgi:hypothetical protein
LIERFLLLFSKALEREKECKDDHFGFYVNILEKFFSEKEENKTPFILFNVYINKR